MIEESEESTLNLKFNGFHSIKFDFYGFLSFFFLLAFLSVECLKETKIEEPCSPKNTHNCHWDSVKFQAVS